MKNIWLILCINFGILVAEVSPTKPTIEAQACDEEFHNSTEFEQNFLKSNELKGNFCNGDHDVENNEYPKITSENKTLQNLKNFLNSEK